MTTDEVNELVHSQANGSYGKINDHRISLNKALIPPHKISVIERGVTKGRFTNEEITVWLVGQESEEGYKIVMHEDGLRFGLAAKGHPTDRHAIMAGWYGSLMSAFSAM